MLSDRLGALFDQTYHNLCPNKQPPVFGKLKKYYLKSVLLQTHLKGFNFHNFSFINLRPYFEGKLELEYNLIEIFPINRKFIRGSTLT